MSLKYESVSEPPHISVWCNPSTLNPNPSILDREHQTPNPEPQTPNAHLWPLIPYPEPLNPKLKTFRGGLVFTLSDKKVCEKAHRLSYHSTRPEVNTEEEEETLNDKCLTPQVAAKVEEILEKVARVEAQRAQVEGALTARRAAADLLEETCTSLQERRLALEAVFEERERALEVYPIQKCAAVPRRARI